MKLTNGFAFIIDTNQYSGNFERELCAYITGRIGECGVGEDFVDSKITELFDNVIDVEDEGCSRPCCIYPTKGRYNNGMGFCYSHGDEEIAIKKLIEDTKKYYQPLIDQREDYKLRLLKGEIIFNWSIEACDREIKTYKEKIEKTLNTTKETLGKYDCYESVVIYFNSKPTEDQINLMKKRALKFNEVRKNTGRMTQFYKDSNIEILGFRLIEVSQNLKEINI